ncbi:hypothetical protein Tco_0282972 [Tanacetum coccineum]
MELKTSSSFKTTGLLQLWQTLCKIFSKCLTARVTGSNMGRALLFSSSSNIFDSVSKIYKDHQVFGIDVRMTQSQSTESTQGSTVIRFRLPKRRSICLTPPVPVPTVDKADEMILQDILHVSLAKHKSQKEQEARENVDLVNKNLASEEIEKMMEGSKNVIDDSLPPRNDEP